MGTDFQRTVLWVFFGMSLFLLWDRWLVYTGKPSMFGTASAPPATAPAPSTADTTERSCRHRSTAERDTGAERRTGGSAVGRAVVARSDRGKAAARHH